MDYTAFTWDIKGLKYHYVVVDATLHHKLLHTLPTRKGYGQVQCTGHALGVTVVVLVDSSQLFIY